MSEKGNELRIHILTRGPVGTNCYFLLDPASKEAVLFDCEGDAADYDAYLKKEELSLKAVLLTHGHFDHIGAVDGLKKLYPEVPVYISETDSAMLGNPVLNASLLFGLGEITAHADKTLQDGQKLSFLEREIICIATPGHTAGGMCYYLPEEELLFAGDTLFSYGMGRSDLPTGDEETLIRSIQERLFTLPGTTRVFPGHGPETNIGKEVKGNPYF